MANESVIASLRQTIQAATSDKKLPLQLHLAELLLRDGLHDECFTLCRDICEDDPGQIDALDIAGRASQKAGNSDRAARYMAVVNILSEAEANLVLRQRIEAGELEGVVPLRALASDPKSKIDADVGERERPGITLDDVAGMRKAKRRLSLAFLGPLKNPELRALYGKDLRGGLLLWGPPGCGKTFLARAVAGELGAKFISVGLDDILDMYIGQSEKNVHTLFESARRSAPCVLFIDEIDGLGQKRSHQRGGSGRNIVAQLLAEMDGVDGRNEGVFVLGATNHPWDVDTALRRPGRLDRTILVLPPDRPARIVILEKWMKDRPVDNVNTEHIADRTEGFSGADLIHLCSTASEYALEASIESGNARPIGMPDFNIAMSEVTESTAAWLHMAKNYAEFSNDGGAYDELLAHIRMRKHV